MERPKFPKRVVITGGMPYGSKELHFGHIGGVFVHADVFARFMKDRIGEDNVIFVSGTDCYGSPIVEKYRTLKADGELDGSIVDFVKKNHDSQKSTLDNYLIGLSLFGASAFGIGGEAHDELSREVFDKLLKSGALSVLSTKQFYDEERDTFLNGRQVVGRCPINGCKSEQAYADECSLGHQYFPEELIAPVSTLSGKAPVLKEVKNWYLDIEKFAPYLKELVSKWEGNPQVRAFLTNVCNESLVKPTLYSKLENKDGIDAALKGSGLKYTCEVDEQKNNCRVEFEKLADREAAGGLLAKNGIRFRTGKTLVPFRISGNIDWGVKIPDHDDMKGLTYWVWPESLWAPISFTRAYLKSIGKSDDEWRNWWCNDDAGVYQFIGEDNIYFYALAEGALFEALNHDGDWNIKMPTIVPNKHILFFNAKASSSGKIKPPMAQELLSHYSPEQLRAHFFGLNLGNASVPFQPKPYNPVQTNQGDPVYKEWSMFTNFLNRAVRTLFYSFQKYNDGNQTVPQGKASDEILQKCEQQIISYENRMYKFEFADVMIELEEFFKYINKTLSERMSALQKEFDKAAFNQTIIDALHLIKTATVLAHPIAPESTEKVREYLGLTAQQLYSWDNIFKTVGDLTGGGHALKFLEPKIDFFTRPEWQYK
ncbi:MAG: class I tRNA ligase family protein [Clostridiales bacterium]|nr:class I tRNA ligase family protein [Clostridiales bacterium]